jgi:hypothetical protein
MAAGNRYASGKPSDCVIHSGKTFTDILCGRKKATVISLGVDSVVTCIKCLKKIAQLKAVTNNKK